MATRRFALAWILFFWLASTALAAPQVLCYWADSTRSDLVGKNWEPLVIVPTVDWCKPPATDFEITADGRIWPARKLSRFLFSSTTRPDWHKKLNLEVFYPVPGEFSVVVDLVSSGGGGFVVEVDGKRLLEKVFPAPGADRGKYAGSYSVKVPAGRHTFTLEGVGQDWVRVARYVFSVCRLPDVRLHQEAACGERLPLSFCLRDERLQPLAGASATLYFEGRALPAKPVPGRPGYYFASVHTSPEQGYQPFWVEAKTALGEAGCTGKLYVRGPALAVDTTLVSAGKPAIAKGYLFSADDEPVTAQRLQAEVRGENCRVTWSLDADDKPCFVVHLPPLSPGEYVLQLHSHKPEASLAKRLLVQAAENTPRFKRGDFVRLTPGKRFTAPSSGVFVPLGMGAMHVFHPWSAAKPRLWSGWLDSAWRNAPPERLQQYLAFLHLHGVNVIRIGLNVPADGIPGDLGRRADLATFEALEKLLALAEPFAIRVLPAFWWGPWGLFGFDKVAAYAPFFAGKDWTPWFKNPEVARLQQSYLAKVVERFKNDPRIFAWELMNEVPPLVQGSEEPGLEWAARTAQFVKQLDTNHLVTVSPCTSDGRLNRRYAALEGVDFGNAHFYTSPDVTTGDEGNVISLQLRVANDCPSLVIIGELGTRGGFKGMAGERRLICRDGVMLGLLAGAPGIIGWDLDMLSPLAFQVAAQALEDVRGLGFTPAKGAIALRLSPRSSSGVLEQWDEYLLNHGLNYELVASSADDSTGKVFDGAKFQPLELPEGPLTIESPVYQGRLRYSKDEAWGLGYLRNCWRKDTAGGRRRGRAELTFGLRLKGKHLLRVYSFDTGSKVLEKTFTEHVQVDLGPTRDDFCLSVQPL